MRGLVGDPPPTKKSDAALQDHRSADATGLYAGLTTIGLAPYLGEFAPTKARPMAALFARLSAVVLCAATPIDIQAQNKAIALRVFEENFNQGRFEVADEIYAPDFKNVGLHQSYDLKADQDAVHEEKRAFPDLKMTVDALVAEGDLVMVMWTFRGTHTGGPFGGIPATGAKLEMRGMTLWRIVDGRIREEWTQFDELGAYLQVLNQRKGTLFAFLGVFILAVILFERGAWALIRRIRSR